MTTNAAGMVDDFGPLHAVVSGWLCWIHCGSKAQRNISRMWCQKAAIGKKHPIFERLPNRSPPPKHSDLRSQIAISQDR
jgi:hypothetical protein